MVSAHGYKKFENGLVQKVKKAAGFTGRGVANALRAAGRFLTRRYTVVFSPIRRKKSIIFM